MCMIKYRLAPISGPASGVSSEGNVLGAPSTGFSALQAVCRGLVCELHALMFVLPEEHVLLCIFLYGKCKPVQTWNSVRSTRKTFTSSRGLFLLALFLLMFAYGPSASCCLSCLSSRICLFWSHLLLAGIFSNRCSLQGEAPHLRVAEANSLHVLTLFSLPAYLLVTCFLNCWERQRLLLLGSPVLTSLPHSSDNHSICINQGCPYVLEFFLTPHPI